VLVFINPVANGQLKMARMAAKTD